MDIGGLQSGYANLGLAPAGGWTRGNLPHKMLRIIPPQMYGPHLGFRDEHESFNNPA